LQQFNDLAISSELKKTLFDLGFKTLTPIQNLSIAPILKGQDIIAKAQTGSGKTLAFALPIVEKIIPQQLKPQVLILAPTRELCEQIAGVIKSISIHKANLKIVTLYGGVPLRGQVTSLSFGADIVIGTAGRLNDHLFRQTLSLENIGMLILDEADRMLDMGFYDDIMKITKVISTSAQTLLFSATYPDNIAKLGSSILKNPISVEVESCEVVTIKEIAYESRDKFEAIKAILCSYKPSSVVIFCNTKIQTDDLGDFLYDEGFDVATIHGDFEQKERDEALIEFSNGSKPILVATDVASRGLDIDNIELIVNFDMPQSAQTYTHRIGRTARAGKDGIAVSLLSGRDKNAKEEIMPNASLHSLDSLKIDKKFLLEGVFSTIQIGGGKKDKLRKGDILGVFCKDLGLDVKDIGRIDIFEKRSYVAIHRDVIKQAIKELRETTIKKRKFRAWLLSK